MSTEANVRRRIGRYELQALIGEGGMGNVYRGLDTKTGRTVAIKLVNMPDDEALAEKLRLRFMREVMAVSRVGHPNVVQVFDYGFSDDNAPYLVMEILSGTDLGKVVRSSKSQLPISYVIDVALEVCAAVRACHAASVIHRDLKPGNIFLAKMDAAPGWRVKVLDFGVAKSSVFEGNLTNLGQIVGTLQYISPEQVNGTVGLESDQYSIGVILYACLTKRLPFSGLKDVALLKAIARGDFAPPRSLRPEIPEALEAIILRAMSVATADRFESVYALGQQLWPFASGLGRRNWERFYTTAPDDAPADAGGTTEVTVLDPPPGAPAHVSIAEAEGSTVIANYDGTTEVGVDQAALIGTLPTKVHSAESDDGAVVDDAPPTTIAPTREKAVARHSGLRGWPLLVGIAAVLLLTAAIVVLLRGG
jgi:serine/threonine protein kinase